MWSADSIVVPIQRWARHWLAGVFIALLIVFVGSVLTWLEPWEPREVAASIDKMAFPLPDKPSIAVLPFTNMGDDPKQEYFTDGMTEDLITDLSRISGLFVIARNSVFTYKRKPVKIAQVAEELGVRYVLEGSVHRAGDQVGISARLIDATTGRHIWAERYNGTLTNVFALQDKVTRKIIAALAVNITAEEAATQAQIETNNPQAYDAFLQGWEHYRKGSPEELKKSITYLEQAIKWDADYSRAYAALAAVYWRTYSNLWYEKVLGVGYASLAFEKARQYLEAAKKVPSPLVHQVSAEIAANLKRKSDTALAEAKRATALDPNDPAGHLAMAIALLKAGKPVEAEEQVREAMRLDPLYPGSYLVLLARTEFAMARYRNAAATLERAVNIDPSNDKSFVYLTSVYGHLGRQADAKAALDKANQLRADAGWGAFTLLAVHQYAFLWVGDARPFREGLRKANVPLGGDWAQLVNAVEGGFKAEGATEIDVEEAKLLHEQNVAFIDVSYQWQERIPGAHFLVIWPDGAPSEFNEVRLARIANRNQKVVIYHGQGRDRRAAMGCAKALTWGFSNVYYLPGGLQKWKAAGYPVESVS